MPLTALGGSTGTVTVGDVSLGLFPQPLHPNVMAYVAAVTANGYSPSRSRVDALNNLVWSLVGEELWDKCQAIYPFLGGTTIDTHKWNIKNVADTNAAFRLTATVVSGFTYSESGVQSNSTAIGQNQFLNTFYIPFSKTSLTTPQSTTSSAHMSAYINVAPTLNGSALIGSAIPGLASTSQLGRLSTSGFAFATVNTNNSNFMQTSVMTTGFYLPVRTGTANVFYRNGANVNSPTGSTSTVSAPAAATYLFNRTTLGSATNGRIGFVSLGDSLTTQESLDFYNIVQAYQTALGRQV
jgi:hypothetical protein